MADQNALAGMSSLLVEAARSAAQADGVLPSDQQQQAPSALQQARTAMAAAAQQQQQQRQQQSKAAAAAKKKGPPLRRGKWTPEEEAYAARLIQEFKAGLLPLTDGTTLRTFLSKLLNCDPMRISKKFVGSNCIGKQVFRRRTADLNRLTPEQIQQSRAELSELERRFLERVAQTNRVKNNGGGGGGVATQQSAVAASSMTANKDNNIQNKDILSQNNNNNNGMLQNDFTGNGNNMLHPNLNPPWLQPPLGYKHGQGAAFAASHLSNARAAAAGRALLGHGLGGSNNSSNNNSNERLLAELQRRASQSSLLNAALMSASGGGSNNQSASNLLAAVRSASAARLAGQFGGGGSNGNNNSSMNSLMLKTALSRDQLSQLARERGIPSSGSLGNMMQRQNSFDALMSLDFQSLQSIDNLANLIQTSGAGIGHNVPESGLKNADFGAMLQAANANSRSNLDLQRRLTSANRMESFLRNLSNGNGLDNSGSNNTDVSSTHNLSAASIGQHHHQGNEIANNSSSSVANLSSFLQSIQGLNSLGTSQSTASLFGGIAGNNNTGSSNALSRESAVNLANLLRQDSHTGLSALRMQDGLNQRNSSVEDFLSLVAAGDIPHTDPNLLNVPLSMQQQDAAAKLLAQQQLLNSSNSALMASALASRSSFGNMVDGASGDGGSAVALAMAQARMAGSKRSLEEFSGGMNHSSQGNPKR